MSCLPRDTFSHFEQREQEILARDAEIDRKRVQAISQAASAIQGAESVSMWRRREVELPVEEDVAEVVAAAVPPSLGGDNEALHKTIRLQNARIHQLQEEFDKAATEASQKDAEAQRLRQELKQVTEQRDRLQKTNEGLEKAQEKSKKTSEMVEEKLKDRELERSELIKVKDELEVKMKKAEAESRSKEARVNRLTEECEKLKAAAKDASLQERDRVSSDRKDVERLTNEVRKLERQRTELVGAFKKQMKLIEVLKRQRAHMEAARVLSFTEDEFIRILELGDKLGER